MLKLKLSDGSTEVFEYNSSTDSRLEIKKEGLRFFDPRLEMDRLLFWEKIDSFEFSHSVSTEQKAYSVFHQKAHSDSVKPKGPTQASQFR